MDRIAEKIAVWLQKTGNSKKSLANMLNVSTTSLNNKLRGKTSWRWREVCSVAEIVGCELSDLEDEAA